MLHKARQILDSRGNPTVEVYMKDGQHSATFSVPSGASVGKNETREKRDGGSKYGGNSVRWVIEQINEMDLPTGSQEEFDSELRDKPSNLSLGLSGAYFRLNALKSGKKLWQYIAEQTNSKPAFPRLYANLINGGKHAPGLDIQEIMAVAEGKPSEAIENIYSQKQAISKLLDPKFLVYGDEGGFVPQARTEDILQMFNMPIALDIAASSLFDGKYTFEGKQLTSDELAGIYLDWDKKYDIVSIEDPFAEEDISAHKSLKSEERKFFIVGDDTTTTNAGRIESLKDAIEAVIIKPNQNGTITGTFEAIKMARENGMDIFVSHRSGETNDDFISDLAYGLGAYGIKLGGLARGERIAKYNRMLTIEEEL